MHKNFDIETPNSPSASSSNPGNAMAFGVVNYENDYTVYPSNQNWLYIHENTVTLSDVEARSDTRQQMRLPHPLIDNICKYAGSHLKKTTGKSWANKPDVKAKRYLFTRIFSRTKKIGRNNVKHS